MTNGINGSYGALQAYRPDATRPTSPQDGPTRSAPAESAQQVKAGDLANRAATNGITTDEQQMVDRYFPGSDKLSLRLYGPDSGARDVTPDALGSRLDVRG